MNGRVLSITVAAAAAFAPACDQMNAEVEESTHEATLPQLVTFKNSTGTTATYNTAGPINTGTTNPFFKSFGINGRTCGSCHVPSANWGITPSEVQARFKSTNGLDPIFRLNDGANSPLANVSTLEARRSAYSMLLRKGLIRVGIGIPANAEFTLAAVDDPHGFASAAELSLFRRPLPTTNIKFLSAVMWDGRESTPLVNGTQTMDMLKADLATQSNSATRGHAEATSDLPLATRQAIVAFQMELFSAQEGDTLAGSLSTRGVTGGPIPLSRTETYFGINDVLGADPMGRPFDPVAFRNFDAWKNLSGSLSSARKAAIERGQAIFNLKQFEIAGVRGVNDALGVESLTGTCTTCHDHPNAGNHSTRLPLDLGLTDESRRTPDMPLYTLRNKTTGEIIKTTDPGRALISGKWKDIALFKGPILRGLVARPPFFHNGFAADLPAVVEFYDTRFSIELTAAQKADLVAFLTAL
jgi:cytochrome c peroxidase